MKIRLFSQEAGLLSSVAKNTTTTDSGRNVQSVDVNTRAIEIPKCSHFLRLMSIKRYMKLDQKI